MKKSFKVILWAMLALQASSDIFAMERNNSCAQRFTEEAAKKDADQEMIQIKLENGKIIELPKPVAKTAPFFNHETWSQMQKKPAIFQFKEFDDNVVELTCNMLNVSFNLDQAKFNENDKNDILRTNLYGELEKADQPDFDIIQAWVFANYLGVPQLEHLFMQVLAETICTPEFLHTFKGGDFFSDHPLIKEFREPLQQALTEYIQIHFPKVVPHYSLSQTLGTDDNGHTRGVDCVCVTPDGKLVSGSGDQTIKIWTYNPATHRYTVSQTLGVDDNGHTRMVNCVCVTPDGKLVSGSYDKTIKIWSYNPETHKYTLFQTLGTDDNGHTLGVICVCVTPDGKLVSGFTSGPIKIWTYNAETHKYTISQTLGVDDNGDTNWVSSVCVTPDGKLVSGSYDKTIKIWTYNPKTHKYTISQTLGVDDNEDTNWVSSVCFTPDGKLVSGSEDKTIKIWTYNPKTQEYTISQTLGVDDNGHTRMVNCVCVTPDGKLVSGSADKTIKIWSYNPETHRYTISQTLGADDNGHTKTVNCVCFTPDGKLVSGSYDETIKIWTLPNISIEEIITKLKPQTWSSWIANKLWPFSRK